MEDASLAPDFGPSSSAIPRRGCLLLRCNLSSLVVYFDAGDTFVGRAPPDLDDNACPSSPQRSDVLPGQERVLLAWARLLRSLSSGGGLGDLNPYLRLL